MILHFLSNAIKAQKKIKRRRRRRKIPKNALFIPNLSIRSGKFNIEGEKIKHYNKKKKTKINKATLLIDDKLVLFFRNVRQSLRFVVQYDLCT